MAYVNVVLLLSSLLGSKEAELNTFVLRRKLIIVTFNLTLVPQGLLAKGSTKLFTMKSSLIGICIHPLVCK